MRSSPELLLLLPLIGACTFSPGEPWGEADISVTAAFAPGADRLTLEGRLRTSTDYAIQLDALSVRPTSVTLLSAAEGAGGLGFDPADPPEGYTLCHGPPASGDCHTEDGRIESYDEVKAKLAASGAGGGTSFVQTATAEVALGAEPQQLPLDPCPEGCFLEPGELQSVQVKLGAVTFSGRVFDRLPPALRRLPEEGVAIHGVVAVEVALPRSAEGVIGEGEQVGLGVDGSLALAPALFDGIDWGTVLGPAPDPTVTVEVGELEGVSAQVAENLAESELLVEITRYDR